jgi:hypothetical protein
LTCSLTIATRAFAAFVIGRRDDVATTSERVIVGSTIDQLRMRPVLIVDARMWDSTV